MFAPRKKLAGLMFRDSSPPIYPLIQEIGPTGPTFHGPLA